MIHPVTRTHEISIDDEDGDSEFMVFEPGMVSNASEYMLRYKDSHPDTSDFPQVQALDLLPVLSVAAFNNVWPRGKFWTKPAHDSNSAATINSRSLGNTRSLKEVSMRTVMEKGMKSDAADDSWLLEAEQLPAFTEEFRAYLYEHPSSVQDGPASLLLGHVLRGCAVVDLSPFSNLSLEGVLAIVQTASSSGSTFSLTLPDLKDLTVVGLRRLLSIRYIHELNIGDHQIGDLSEIIHCIDGTSVTSFTTPDMYSRRFFKQRDVHDDITFSERGGICAKPWSSPVSTLPRPRQCCVTQMVYVNCRGHVAGNPEMHSEMDALPWSAIIDEEFDGNSETALFTLPLADAFWSPSSREASHVPDTPRGLRCRR